MRYIVWYASQNAGHSVPLYDYAVSGASCSNRLTPRGADVDIESYEMPAFYADVNYTSPNGSHVINIDPSTTIYTMWIGTNDLGNDTYLTDGATPGTTIVDYLDCVYDQIGKISASPINGEYLVLLNVAPLQLVPMYQLPNISGLDEGWPNATEIYYRMWEQVALVNEAYEWRTLGEVLIKKRYGNMKIAVYDVNRLVSSNVPEPLQMPEM